MTAIGTVTIDRSGMPGSLAALAITTDNSGTYTLGQGGLGRVGRIPRATLATASPFVNGQARTSVVLDESSIALLVRVQSTTSSGLNTAVVALEAALFQFSYTVTVVVDGVTKVYDAYPATVQSTDGLTSHERVIGFFEDLAVSIPVYPVAS